MSHVQKSRVTVDFFMDERDILQELCNQDIRPPQEQIRWLVLNEAKRRNRLHEKSDNAGILVGSLGDSSVVGITN